MSEVQEIVEVPSADGEAAQLDDDAALEAALAELARGFVRLREEGR